VSIADVICNVKGPVGALVRRAP